MHGESAWLRGGIGSGPPNRGPRLSLGQLMAPKGLLKQAGVFLQDPTWLCPRDRRLSLPSSGTRAGSHPRGSFSPSLRDSGDPPRPDATTLSRDPNICLYSSAVFLSGSDGPRGPLVPAFPLVPPSPVIPPPPGRNEVWNGFFQLIFSLLLPPTAGFPLSQAPTTTWRTEWSLSGTQFNLLIHKRTDTFGSLLLFYSVS